MGPQGLDKFQQWFHKSTQRVLGGRLEFADPEAPYEGLQSQYATKTVVTNTALISGGLGAHHQPYKSKRFIVTANFGATLPLAPGLGSLRSRIGIELHPLRHLSVFGGVSLAGNLVTTQQLEFLTLATTRPGAHAGFEYLFAGRAGLRLIVQTGGIRDEPVYALSLVAALGSLPQSAWLSPLP